MTPAAKSNTVKIRVDQADGDISLALDGDEAVTYPVSDHLATVPADLAPRFIAAVDGSQLAGGNPADSTKE